MFINLNCSCVTNIKQEDQTDIIWISKDFKNIVQIYSFYIAKKYQIQTFLIFSNPVEN